MSARPAIELRATSAPEIAAPVALPITSSPMPSSVPLIWIVLSVTVMFWTRSPALLSLAAIPASPAFPVSIVLPVIVVFAQVSLVTQGCA